MSAGTGNRDTGIKPAWKDARCVEKAHTADARATINAQQDETMEHRLYPRIPIRLEVEIIWEQKIIGKTHSNDISLDGMQLEVLDIGLHTGQMVEVNIMPKTNPTVNAYNTLALVVYVTDEHAGLMLNNGPCLNDLLRTSAQQGDTLSDIIQPDQWP